MTTIQKVLFVFFVFLISFNNG